MGCTFEYYPIDGIFAEVIKAQVHVGGRGKAGGVKLADTPQEAYEKAQAILGMNLKGLTVKKVLVAEAVDIAIDLGQVSISMLQRKMRIGYARAGRIIDEMSRRGIVSEADGSKPRNILISREQANEMFEECA